MAPTDEQPLANPNSFPGSNCRCRRRLVAIRTQSKSDVDQALEYVIEIGPYDLILLTAELKNASNACIVRMPTAYVNGTLAYFW